MNNEIREIVSRYRNSSIQSEAEVRTKLVLPLLKVLGFPDENRAEEFPIYAYQSKGTLHADFLLFASSSFSKNRENKKDQIDWVAKHSLLVVETKAPGKLPETEEQPAEYALRSKAVAYIFTDGELVKGYYIQPFREDSLVFSCKVDNLDESVGVDSFSYAALIRRKKEMSISFSPTGLVLASVDSEEPDEIITSDEFISLPDEYINGLKHALGKEDEELSKVKVLQMFLSRTDNILQNDYRYGIPKYMMGIPRGVENGTVYISNDVLFSLSGSVTIYYRDDEDVLSFDSGFLQMVIHMNHHQVDSIYIQPQVYSDSVTKRIENYETVLKLYKSTSITVVYEYRNVKQVVTAEKSRLKFQPSDITDGIDSVQMALDYMKDLHALENYYSVVFNLSLFDKDNLDIYHGDLEKVYYLKTSMRDEDNYFLGMPVRAFKGVRKIQGGEVPVEMFPEWFRPGDIFIYGIHFSPEKVIISNRKISFIEKLKKGYIEISVCWKYRLFDGKKEERDE